MWAQLLTSAASFAAPQAGGQGGAGSGSPGVATTSSNATVGTGQSPISTGGITINESVSSKNPLVWVAGGVAFVFLLKVLKK